MAADTKATWSFAVAMRTNTVMASPLMNALATRWIEDGTADLLLRFIRTERAWRQRLAAEILPAGSYRHDPISFNIWLTPGNGWTRPAFIEQMRGVRPGIVASDAVTVDGTPAGAVRVCPGGPIDRARLRLGPEFMARALEASPDLSSAFFQAGVLVCRSVPRHAGPAFSSQPCKPRTVSG